MGRSSGKKLQVTRLFAATLAAGALIVLLTGAMASPVLAADAEEQVHGGQPWPDPLESFNDKMFWFNLKLDHYILHPVAQGYADVVPEPGRRAVGHFFNNIGIVPRFANDLFQLHWERAAIELTRFGVNTTLGVAGFFDVADKWFGLKQQDNDFGMTLGYYGISPGPYLVLPFLGPSTIRDAVGLAADSSMSPLDWLTPWYIWLPADTGWDVGSAVNYRSLHLNMFEEADRYAIDLYGAVQDGYMEKRAAELKAIRFGQQ